MYKVKGSFICYYNNLVSLEGCPEEVEGNFDCSDNYLTSLKGCPKYIGGYFNCSKNKLVSLEYFPKEIKGDCYINSNTREFKEEEIRKVCKVHGHIYVQI